MNIKSIAYFYEDDQGLPDELLDQQLKLEEYLKYDRGCYGGKNADGYMKIKEIPEGTKFIGFLIQKDKNA